MKSLCLLLVALPLWAAEPTTPLLSLNDTTGIKARIWGKGEAPVLTIEQGEGRTTDGDGSLLVTAKSVVAEGSQYVSFDVKLPEPVDLTGRRLFLDARTDHPGNTSAFYFRAFNAGESKACWSFQSWGKLLGEEWKTYRFQHGLCTEGLGWEPGVVEDRQATAVDRLQFIFGTRENEVEVSLMLDNLRLGDAVPTIADLDTATPLAHTTTLVKDGQPTATVLHPDSEAGRQAAQVVVDAVKQQTGVTLPARAGTPEDREPETAAILLGDIDSNPALMVLYARYLTPVDMLCPGPGGSLVHNIPNPFGQQVGVVVVGASDDAGLAQAAKVFAEVVARQPKGGDLTLAKVFERGYSDTFLARYRWADDPEDPKALDAGLKEGQARLDRGIHTSIAGSLQACALKYQLTGHSVYATLFVKLWDMYAASAVADPRKYGGPWGFDSDFPAAQVVFGWDIIEHDPVLTDADRLRTTQSMARWLREAVIPKCLSAASGTNVPFNHQTFPGLGALAAGIYFTKDRTFIEGQQWLGAADAIFQRQAGYYKVHEDCNGYQWLTNGHLMRYCMARPDWTVFENGNAKKVVSYLIGVMNNLGYQVPYGDTGSWQCWNSEMFVLDTYAYATGDPSALWAANYKRDNKHTFDLYSFYRPDSGIKPDDQDGVKVWPLEPQWYQTFKPPELQPEYEQCFDKVTFREAMDPNAAYLLLDGLSPGGHKHYDGNSLPQLTQFDRIWLADNDYFKSQVKYHNSLLVFRDGQSAPIPPYAELLGAGESQRYGFSRTRLTDFAGADWDRTVVWLKELKSFVVLDRLVARHDDTYQLNLLWHGVGEPKFDSTGLLLRQNGPSLRIQTLAGPRLRLEHDAELGANWKGYPHAEPVVQSLTATANVKLAKGESYLFVTALHGVLEGDAPDWTLGLIDGVDGVYVNTPRGRLGIGLGPFQAQTPQGDFSSDAQVLIVDDQGLSLLDATHASMAGMELYRGVQPGCVDVPQPEASMVLDNVPLRPPVPNLEIGGDAPAHPERYNVQPQPARLTVSGNKDLPGSVDLGVKLTSEPAPAAHNVFNEGAPNQPAQLLDGQWGNDTTTSVMYEPDQTVTLTLDLGAPCELAQIRWMQWWATSSSKQTKYLLGKATVQASSDAFQADTRELGIVTDAGPHPNFGSPLEYSVDAKGAQARYLRLVLEPQPGAGIYLAQVLVEGKPAAGQAQAVVVPYHFSRLRIGQNVGGEGQRLLAGTDEGELMVLDDQGQLVWEHQFPDRVNDLMPADLDGDGKDEVIVARQDSQVTVLDDDGSELWSRELAFYRRPPYVNVALAGDLDGDGKPEVIVGGENWRFYAFDAKGQELWNYESVHPSRSGAVADLDGDGKCEVVCGTHYYWWATLNPDGTQRWGLHAGPICYDVATGSFNHDQTRGVVYGGGDGYLYVLDSKGEKQLAYNTGDEVRWVAAADLNGDDADEVYGISLNGSLYCFGPDMQRLWRADLGGEPSALAVVPEAGIVVAGTGSGKLLSFDATGKLVALSDLKSGVVDLAADQGDLVVATEDGRLRRVGAKP